MTKTLTYPEGYAPTLTTDLQTVPGLAPAAPPGGGLAEAQFLVGQHADGSIVVTVPDATDEAAVTAVWTAHDRTPIPQVVDYAGSTAVDAITRTTDGAPHEVFRFPCAQQRLYRADLTITGVDAGTFASKVMEGRFTWKRAAAGAVVVGLTVVSDVHDTAAASWAPNYAASGNDVVFTVQGAAGRTVDWMLAGSVSAYAPGGLAS